MHSGARRSSGTAPLLLLHGWMDVGASCLVRGRCLRRGLAAGRLIIARLARRFGGSRLPAPCDSHHFVDYLADLDRLLDHYAGAQLAVDLVKATAGESNVI